MKEFLQYLTSPRFLISVGLVIGAVLIWLIFRRFYKRAKERTEGDKKRFVFLHTCKTVLKSVLIVFTVLLILQVNDINISSTVASLGLVSAVVGLALQDLFKDFIMGFHIVSDHFFGVGDVILYRETEQVVIALTAKSTKLRSIYDGAVTTVCNRDITEATVLTDILDLPVPLPYDRKT